MDPKFKQRLEKQHYALVGNHSAVKLCHWLKQSLVHNRQCYKQDFYGISSHRCLQMTPTITHCNHTCLFCWRYQEFTETTLKTADDPEYILEAATKAQQKLITGYKGDPRTNQQKWQEANTPNMVACSLSGEPTLYPFLGSFFEECHKKGMTTFLVSNGTNPEFLANLDPLPTQLYISLIAPTKEVYKKLCVPLVKKGWERFLQTMEILPSLDTRTVIRQTLINQWNMKDEYISNYSQLIQQASPDFIEAKGYVFVGSSRNRMHLSHMPSHQQIIEYSKSLTPQIGYDLTNQKEDSRVVLLSKHKKTARIVQ